MASPPRSTTLLGKNTADLWADNATQSFNYSTLRDKARNIGPAPFDVKTRTPGLRDLHLPFGRNRRFSTNNRVLNADRRKLVLRRHPGRAVGHALPALQWTSDLIRKTRRRAGGWPVGQRLQKMIKVVPVPASTGTSSIRKIIGSDGRANPAFLAPPTTPGEQDNSSTCGPPKQWNLDAAMNKTVALTSSGLMMALPSPRPTS